MLTLLLLLVSGVTALAAVPVDVPEPLHEAWRGPAELQGWALGPWTASGQAVRVVFVDRLHVRLEVRGEDGRVRTRVVDRPTSEADREDLLSLARALLREGRAPALSSPERIALVLPEPEPPPVKVAPPPASRPPPPRERAPEPPPAVEDTSPAGQDAVVVEDSAESPPDPQGEAQPDEAQPDEGPADDGAAASGAEGVDEAPGSEAPAPPPEPETVVAGPAPIPPAPPGAVRLRLVVSVGAGALGRPRFTGLRFDAVPARTSPVVSGSVRVGSGIVEAGVDVRTQPGTTLWLGPDRSITATDLGGTLALVPWRVGPTVGVRAAASTRTFAESSEDKVAQHTHATAGLVVGAVLPVTPRLELRPTLGADRDIGETVIEAGTFQATLAPWAFSAELRVAVVLGTPRGG